MTLTKLGNHLRGPMTVWRFGEFELDTQRYELRGGGAVIRVEPQVFDVMTHLVGNSHRMVTKEELFDTVWGGRFVGEAALTTRIKAARRALGDDGESQRYIRTVRGRGYQFVGAVTGASATHTAAARPEPPPPRQHIAFSPGRRRCPVGLRGGGRGTAAGARGQLDDASGLRHREFRVAALGS